MTRTTLDIDDGVLRRLKERRERERRSLGEIASELLAVGLAATDDPSPATETFTWHSAPMGALIDIDDRDALWAALDR